jgi:ubiquinone/menaquinone biosynthesis C-methylase UbiE
VSFQEGDALKLPFEVPSFDAAVASQVYEFVEDVPRALKELHRVLVPGGTAVIVDTDWSSLVWEARDRKRAERIIAAWEDHLADPHLPRRMAPALREARFEVAEVRPYTMFSLAHDTFTAGLTALIAGFVPGHRGVKEEDASAWAAELARLSDEGAYFFSLTAYLFRAVRPSPE